jgi:general secretion pathway protein C
LNLRHLNFFLTCFFVVISAFIVADMVNTLGRGAFHTTSSFAKAVKKPVIPFPPPPAEGRTALAPGDGAPPTVTLVGTTTGAYPYAVIILPGRGQELFRLKDDVGGGWLIDEIDANRVVLKNGPRREAVEVAFTKIEAPNAGAAGAPAATRGGIRLDPRDVEGALSDLNKVLTQARAVPYMIGGKISGYQLLEIVPGSLYTKLGLQNNDVVERVNGVEIRSPDTLYQLFQQIKNERRIALDISRGGKRESMNIEIR